MIKRYFSEEMSSIWSEDNKVKQWLEVEKALIQVLEDEKIAPKGLLKKLKSISVTPEEVLEREGITNHDLAAFVDVLQNKLGEGSNWIHYGLTSSDVVDTASALIIREGIDIIKQQMSELIAELKNKAVTEADTPIIGRTHGIHAEPTSLGSIFGNWCLEVSRGLKRLSSSAEKINYGKMSGAVGNHPIINEKLEKEILDKLSLSAEPLASQVVSRDRYADLFSSFALIAGSYERIAVNIRHYQRSEVGEMFESFEEGQKGSSAMPHKKNPIGSERICGLARVVRGNTQASFETMSLWHERDISNSSVERIILPDTFGLIDFMSRDLKKIISNLVIDHSRIRKNLESAESQIVSQKLLTLIVSKGIDRDRAYRLIQKLIDDNSTKEKMIEKINSTFNQIEVLELEECYALSNNIDGNKILEKLKNI